MERVFGEAAIIESIRQEISLISVELAKYDREAMLTLIGALHLAPENARWAPLLDVLAGLAAALPQAHGLPTLSPESLLELLGGKQIATGGRYEPTGPFTEEFVFFHGSYLVCTMGNASTLYGPRNFTQGLFLHEDGPIDPSLGKDSAKLIEAALVVSDAVTRRAGLSRHLAPVSVDDERLFVPDEERLSRLRLAVRFQESELADVLGAGLGAVVVRGGEVSPFCSVLPNSEVPPVVRVADSYVVVCPSALITAAMSKILERHNEVGLADELSQRYHDAIWENVVHSLSLIGVRPHPFDVCGPAPFGAFSREFFSLDVDKVLYVTLATQPLCQPQLGALKGEWDLTDTLRGLVSHVNEVGQQLRTTSPSCPQLLHLLVFQEWNGWYRVSPDLVGGLPRALWLPAVDLETLALVDGGDPLRLWKYVSVVEELQAERPFWAEEALDLYCHYRRCGHSYFIPDDVSEEPLWIPSGGALTLRLEVIERWDPHGVPTWRDAGYVEVIRSFSTERMPIYLPRGSGLSVARVVEGLPCPVWVVHEHVGEADLPLHALYNQFADALAYWLWQLTGSLTPLLSEVIGDRVVIWVNLQPGDGWVVPAAREGLSSGLSALNISAFPDDLTLQVDMGPGIADLFQGPDNRGERQWVQSILQGLQSLLSSEGKYRLTEDGLSEILSRVAPLGQKKYMLWLNADHNPALDPRGIPDYRSVQDSDQYWVERAIGRHLLRQLQPGPIEGPKRGAVLNDVVTMLYGELQSTVGMLDPEGLLEWLLAYQEAIVREAYGRQLSLPARTAANGPMSRQAAVSEISDLSRTALASRFLIEYVTARPPHGSQPISLAAYDRLLALAAAIIEKGFASDLIQYGIFDLPVQLLPFGRLQVDRRGYEEARARYMERFASGLMADARDRFSDHWRQRTEVDEAALEQAATSHLGLTLADLLTVLGHTGGIGDDIDPGVMSFPLEQLTAELVRRLGWPRKRIETALEHLTLAPRGDFLKPQAPFRSQDVFPWRFRRGLSYLRRPLIIREREGIRDVLWGGRQLFDTARYLVGLFQAGRLDGLGQDTQVRMGSLRDAEGRAFEEAVCSLLERNPHLTVKRQVRKVGKLRPGNDVGDFDVVAVDKRTNEILVLECKNLARALAPHELYAESCDLYGTEGGKPSHVDKVLRRQEWLHLHRREFLAFLMLDPEAKWEIKSLIVVSEELQAPHLWRSEVAVVSYGDLERAYGGGLPEEC